MSAAILAKIPKHARLVVRRANDDGSLDRGELTMSAARLAVCKSLGLPPDGLDGGDARSVVKNAIRAAIEALEDGEDGGEGSEPEGSKSSEEDEPPARKPATKAKPKARASKGRKSTATVSDGESEEEPPKASSRRKPAKREESAEVEVIEVPASPASSVMSSVYDEPPKRGKAKTKPRSASVSSAMSSVYDEPPTKRKAAAAKGAATKAKKPKKDPNEGLSADEVRVNNLKKMVLACGVRKMWTKELADCSTPREQAKHIVSLLESLGIVGKPTLAKAKALKEQRELASELNDVKQFEASRGLSARGRGGRSRRSDVAAGSGSDNGENGTKDSSAMAAVMDFLGDDDSD
ncbi:hypothetical protein Q8F55_006435 [Vanrija albida]|uniref:Histone chaperone domain-containing protein n=1 Tax=Vanrija albida TaxID=181172 RepID=A0ABR3PX32_9TREE